MTARGLGHGSWSASLAGATGRAPPAGGVPARDGRADGFARRIMPVEPARSAVRDGSYRPGSRPHPGGPGEEVRLPGGERVLLRPIRPEDEPALREEFARMTPDDVRMRFFLGIKRLDHATATRLTRIDHDQGTALVATDPATGDLLGDVRLMADPDGRRAEFAVMVRSDRQGRGLGRLLMDRILADARLRGVREVWGAVLAENRAMLGLARALGFRVHDAPGERGVVRVVLDPRGGSDDAGSASPR